jgi:hypothetical protein
MSNNRSYGGPAWWDEMANVATEQHCVFSADWYRSMRDQYVARFPNADRRSLDNMNSFVIHAERAESGS